MGFIREKRLFDGFCREYGGECRVLRRSYLREGDRDTPQLLKVGESRCLLTGWQDTLPDINPAAMNRSRARLYLPARLSLQAGDCVEVHWGKNVKRFIVSGEPERYPSYTAAAVRKEEWA